MPMKNFLVQAIEQNGVEVRIYQVFDGYRVEVSGFGTQFFWHPGIFPSLSQLRDWLLPQLEAFVEDGMVFAGEWMMLEGDFDGNGLYQDWFICETATNWQGYDPLTNRCHTALSWQALKVQIDKIQLDRQY